MFNWTELSDPCHHRQRVVGHRHFHGTHLAHARRAHRGIIRHNLADTWTLQIPPPRKADAYLHAVLNWSVATRVSLSQCPAMSAKHPPHRATP